MHIEQLDKQKETLFGTHNFVISLLKHWEIANEHSNGNINKKVLKEFKKSLSKLNPLVKNGEAKHPRILPYKHHITTLLIQHFHSVVGHRRQELVLASLRQKFGS